MEWEVENVHLMRVFQEIVDLGNTMKRFSRRAREVYFTNRYPWIVPAMLGLAADYEERTVKDLQWELEDLPEDAPVDYTGPHGNLLNFSFRFGRKILAELTDGLLPVQWPGLEAVTVPAGIAGTRRVAGRHVKALIKEMVVMGQRMARVYRFDKDAESRYFMTRLPDIVLDMLGCPKNFAEPLLFDENGELVPVESPARYSRCYDMFTYPSFVHEEKLDGVLKRICSYKEEHERIKAAQRALGPERMACARKWWKSLALSFGDLQPEES